MFHVVIFLLGVVVFLNDVKSSKVLKFTSDVTVVFSELDFHLDTTCNSDDIYQALDAISYCVI